MSVITVTNSGDSGTGSLRAALAAAAPGDTIAFASGVTSISLTSPLVIDQAVTIDGDHAHNNASVTINGEVIVQLTGNVTMNDMRVVSTSAGLAATANAQAGVKGSVGTDGLPGTQTGQPGTKGGDGDPGGDATAANGAAALAGTPAIENDGKLTLINSTVTGTASGGKGAGGAGGAVGGQGGAGGTGGTGFASPSGFVNGGNGANGGTGGDGGSGSSGTDGAEAVGGIINTGDLTLEDSIVTGKATGGAGGAGGKGGAGAAGGAGGGGGFSIGIGAPKQPPVNPSAGGNGGDGGNGGSGGNGGDGGAGGSAVGGILNTGKVTVVGAAVLANDSATAGSGGKGGLGADPGTGGAGGTGGSGDPFGSNGLAGSAGNEGHTGVTGAAGTATKDILNDGGTESGKLTINGRIFDLNTDLSGQASTVNISGSKPTTFTYDAQSLSGASPKTGTVEWKILTGADGPLLKDFTGPTSGTLTFSSNATSADEAFSIELSADAAAPRDEVFTVELLDPSTGNVIGSLKSLTQHVVNLTAPACFASGTGIRTARGDIAVEDLAIGDLIVTVSGVLRPVKWLGSRNVDCAHHGRPAAVYPVRVQAGAFGLGVPTRDLFLSPDHALYTEDVLIPVKHLINGKTIAQTTADSVTYFHVELDAHDVLLAEGLACESYLDTGDRTSFAYGHSVTELHPAWGSEARDIALLTDGLSYAPLRVTGMEVELARAALAASMLAEVRPAEVRPAQARLSAA
ncbi:Hint domain-containing protein [Acidisoma cellulosilytica]|uniref:Hint domain-containing protein n=1 Tax=Acidisoma cellulosilyticum TaxID=2802395 RepID=A0A964E6N6_9PROT|nr:Hint domain-containing protein [Acidisoma cellulosilyticum]MCB8883771.1 Hint domain-containing protein [Acidisoma cellulosilyticum]